jgi:hypothetical protein
MTVRLGTYPEVICDLLQATFEVTRGAHHVLDVVHSGEPRLKELKEGFLGRGQG